ASHIDRVRVRVRGRNRNRLPWILDDDYDHDYDHERQSVTGFPQRSARRSKVGSDFRVAVLPTTGFSVVEH
ncbi:MAG: hypothetical protein VBE63_27830, partial [Lamprobacter sp.]|uniref:hypothetical protein n=1 Tax=Lamprobacter sp. TaxID=3100796 RepID=UPI002B25ABAA